MLTCIHNLNILKIPKSTKHFVKWVKSNQEFFSKYWKIFKKSTFTYDFMIPGSWPLNSGIGKFVWIPGFRDRYYTNRKLETLLHTIEGFLITFEKMTLWITNGPQSCQLWCGVLTSNFQLFPTIFSSLKK